MRKKTLWINLKLRTFTGVQFPKGVIGVLPAYRTVKDALVDGCKRHNLLRAVEDDWQEYKPK